MSQHLFGLLHKNKISPDQYCVLWHFANGVSCPTTITELQGIVIFLKANGYLDKANKATDKAKELITDADKLFRKSKVEGNSRTLGDGYMEHVKAFRLKFPADRKSSNDEVRDKVARIFQKVPGLTWDTIHAATDLYLGTVSDLRYCMKAGNFIEKDGTQTIMEYIERVQEGESSHITGNLINLVAA